MTQLGEMLRGERSPGVLHGRDVPSRRVIERLVTEYGWQIRDVDLADVDGKQGFIEAWARGLGFPAWHGKNWDAFEEMLHDLSWLGDLPGCIVTVHRMRESDADVEFGMAIVEDAVERRREGEMPLIVLVR
ncbi:barstar family protein [bacterium]|nr:barstar family protein [bacterium]